MGKMKVAAFFLCFTSLFVSFAQASKFWEDFYVNFGDWKVEYPVSTSSGDYKVGDIVNLALDNTTGKIWILLEIRASRFVLQNLCAVKILYFCYKLLHPRVPSA